jgi:hypothetical protein
MRGMLLLSLALLLGGCTNVAQMQRRYQAGDQRQLTRLTEIVARPDYPYATRRKAARALGEIGDPRAVPALTGVLIEYEQRTTLKQEALVALARIGDAEAVEAIGRMLDFQLGTANAEVRMTAIESLGRLGGSRAARILVNALAYYDQVLLFQEQRSYRGIYSGQEQVYNTAPGYADTTRSRTRGPQVGVFSEGQGQVVNMFGLPVEMEQAQYDPTPEEQKLSRAALVQVGEAAVPVIDEYLAGKQVTNTLEKELLAIVGQIRQTAPADSSRAALPAPADPGP